MSEEHVTPSPPAPSVPAPQPVPAPRKDPIIIIRMWPKTPVLYPMALVALICSLVGHFAGSSDLTEYPFKKDAPAEDAPAPGDAPAEDAPAPEEQGGGRGAPQVEDAAAAPDAEAEARVIHGEADLLLAQAAPEVDASGSAAGSSRELEKKRVDRTLAVVFLIILYFALFAICVDLDVRWAIIYASAAVILALVLLILDITVGFLPKLIAVLDHITPMANPQFFMGIFLIWVLLMVISFVVTRFHYARVEANEVVVVGGMLERQQRYDTMRMRYTKEIHDVMEYYLPFVRSGRLIFSFPEQAEAVIIDNVINIKKVTAQLDELVGSTAHDHTH